jgi:hypothetical protein
MPERTIQSVCQKRLGMLSCYTTKQPLLTEKMVRKRIAFCKKHQARTKIDWENVMSRDELTPPYQPRAMKVRRLSAMSQYIQAEVRS